MAFRTVALSCVALTSLVRGKDWPEPWDCILDEGNGQKQVWVPDCRGAGCNANGKDNECAWYVYDMELCKATYGGACEETAAARAAQNVTSYRVLNGSYNVEGYVCSGTQTDIWYPDGEGPFPVVVYLHGASVFGRTEAFEIAATYGLVVIKPVTGGYPGTCSSTTQWQEAVTAITASKKGGASLSPGLGKVDWSKQGVWGFSMGAKTTPTASVQTALNVGAIACSHGARNSELVTVPSFYLTGTRDTSSSPPDVMLAQFDENKAKYKVFENEQGGTHSWTKGTFDPWVAKFFACHLAGSETDCAAVYGSGPGTLCAAYHFSQCFSVQPSSSDGNLSVVV